MYSAFMTEFEQKFFEHTSPSGQVHKMAYTQWGNGEDLLVCVHGLTRNARDFDWLAKAMCGDYDNDTLATPRLPSDASAQDGLKKPSYTVICPSMPGRGMSDWLDNAADYSNEYNIEITLALAASFNAKNIDWVGTSMGGIMAMIIGCTMPKLLRKIVLNDIGALISEDGMRRIKNYVAGEVKFENKDIAEKRFKEIFAPFNIKSEDDWQHYMFHGLRETSDGQFSFNHDPKMGAAFPEPEEIDMWRLWDSINVPTLILRGADSDILPKDVAHKMAERPNATLVEFEGYGHVPPLIDADQVSVVRNFLCS